VLVWIGSTEPEWKFRYNNYTHSFKNDRKETATCLSKYVSKITKDKGAAPELRWSLLKNVPAYTNISKRCLLCLSEKAAIIYYDGKETLLNQREEFVCKCRHQNKFKLKEYDKSRKKPP